MNFVEFLWECLYEKKDLVRHAIFFFRLIRLFNPAKRHFGHKIKTMGKRKPVGICDTLRDLAPFVQF